MFFIAEAWKRELCGYLVKLEQRSRSWSRVDFSQRQHYVINRMISKLNKIYLTFLISKDEWVPRGGPLFLRNRRNGSSHHSWALRLTTFLSSPPTLCLFYQLEDVKSLKAIISVCLCDGGLLFDRLLGLRKCCERHLCRYLALGPYLLFVSFSPPHTFSVFI